MREMSTVAVVSLSEGKRLVKLLESRGVNAALDHDQDLCQRGCAVTVALKVKNSQLEQFQEIYRQDYIEQTGLEPHQLSTAATENMNHDQIECPACGQQFPRLQSECPSCGLCF